ncbi:hypothetical protein H4582DRAFT_1284064 [Lactarius indigo]|nr:hypothetical protein H4582DRAFT_1284064 [Lactarius indigo]
MTRRVNRSKKVPGVKLRPARPEGAGTLAEQRTPPPSSRLSDPPEDFEISFIDTCPRPFRGFTICTTGVDRSTIFPKVGEMGANTTAAFTDYVTHLIAEEHGGAKYWCAVERKIPILRPSWIQDTFEIWQRGDDFDFAAKVEEHRLPTFSGITLCVSGIEDLDRRTSINRTVTQHCGKYAKNIERPVRVTHLLCSGNDETDKMRYARKFNERGEANIKLVWEEWFWDSLDFGGRFEETTYLVTHPRPERRRLPLLHQPTCKDSELPQEQPQVDADALDEEEMAVARRVPGATLRVWESLLAPRGYTKVGSELVKAGPAEAPNSTPEPSLPSSGAKRDKGKRRALNPPSPPTTRKGRSALGTFSRSKSFAPCTTSMMEDPSTSTTRQPFRKAHSLFLPQLEPPAHVAPEPDGSKLPIFSGMRFRVRAEARSASVRSAIENCGGIWVENEDEEERIDFVIVRLVSGSKLYVDEADATLKPRYRTECWLEGCLSRERICSVDEHPSFSPLPHTIHLPGVILSPSGLDLAEDTWVKRLARALGITHAPAFSRSTTHLLCPGATGAKYARARTWGTPVVDIHWLSHIARTGALPQPEMFLVPFSCLQDADTRHTTIPAKVPDLAQAEQTTTLLQKTPPAHTPPLQTTQPDTDPANQELSFGRPSLLADRDEVVPSSSPTLPPASSPSGSPRPHSFSLSEHTSGPSNHSSGPAPAPGSDTGDDDEAAPRVPSSNTPSPLRMPSDQTDPAARALHESISNLLGKRSVGAMTIGEYEGPPPRRKRARPQSKLHSLFQPDTGGADTSIGMGIDAGVSNIHLPPISMYTTSFAFGDEPENGNPNSNTALDDSMSSGLQAVYEDPSQAAERRKLISLLNGAPGQSRMREERIHRAAVAAARSNVATSSGRMAGF